MLRNAFGGLSTEDGQGRLEAILRRIVQALISPFGYDKSLQRYKASAVMESGTLTTVTTVTTVTTAGNVAAIGGLQGTLLVYGQNYAAWAACVRSKIS